MKRLSLLTAALVAAGFALSATPAGALSDKDRPAIEAIVRDYLVKHPEVIGEALQALKDKQDSDQAAQATKAIADNRALIFDSPRGPYFGNPKGDVTLVEFFDYNCGYCRRALSDVIKLTKNDPKLKIVLKELPLLGPQSLEAAKIAIAARMQDPNTKYFVFHTSLMSGRGQIGKDQALQAAKAAGYDMTRLQKDSQGPEVTATLQESKHLMDSLGINGTPTFVIGNEMVVGAVPYEELKGAIDSVRKCGKATC